MANIYNQKPATRGAKSEGKAQLGNKEKKGAEKCTGFNLQRSPKELEIHDDEGCRKFMPDEDATRVLSKIISGWVPVNIYFDILDLLRGLEPKLAMKVANYIGDFCWGMGRTVTGIEFLDMHLLNFYKRIYDYAKANGHKLEMPCPF